jgi:hypothetical protein
MPRDEVGVSNPAVGTEMKCRANGSRPKKTENSQVRATRIRKLELGCDRAKTSKLNKFDSSGFRMGLPTSWKTKQLKKWESKAL